MFEFLVMVNDWGRTGTALDSRYNHIFHSHNSGKYRETPLNFSVFNVYKATKLQIAAHQMNFMRISLFPSLLYAPSRCALISITILSPFTHHLSSSTNMSLASRFTSHLPLAYILLPHFYLEPLSTCLSINTTLICSHKPQT